MMDMIMGANGHVGASVAGTSLAHGQSVLVTRHGVHDEGGRAGGAIVVTADDVASLRAAFQRGQRPFPLNLPADIAIRGTTTLQASVRGLVDRDGR